MRLGKAARAEFVSFALIALGYGILYKLGIVQTAPDLDVVGMIIVGAIIVLGTEMQERTDRITEMLKQIDSKLPEKLADTELKILNFSSFSKYLPRTLQTLLINFKLNSCQPYSYNWIPSSP